MSHVGIIAPPFPSHWRAMQALGRGLQRQGHRVTFFHQHDAARLLSDPALGFVALGQQTHPPGSLDAVLRRAANPGSPWGLKRVIADLARTTDMLCRELPQALSLAGVDALVCDQMEAAGGLVAEARQMPWVSVACALPVNREPGIPLPVMPWSCSRRPRDLEIQAASTRVYDHLMSPQRRVIEHHAAAFGLSRRGALHECLSPWLQISQTVRDFDFPRPAGGDELQHVGPLREPMQQEFDGSGLSAGRPFVFASLGTLQGQRERTFQRIAQACASQDVQLLIAHCGGLSTRQAQALRRPGQVWVTDFAPQQAVLERADAVVSHAGLNTVMDAFTAAVPVLALPIAFDQPGVAARLVHAGAGLKASPRWTSSREMGRALRRLLDEPAFGARSAELGQAVRQAGGTDRAVALIEGVLRSGPSGIAHVA
ncbi:zeaxanthin glucosyltransferase [Stenotrophomonas sp. Betaine-02u-21]|uniref:glycosyltransferase n=1 Tax=unclassified Stenotrophomonas TaxID=196198 RepID=UPI000C3462E2|nr:MULTISPECIES: glycosyltransferase [unclassified Stenotrophomonas]PKH69701.1 zeaxanthin glucosyltransferase [Stenotrophomonas sp. Betaine-02u-23]PKH74193.1 zeaxanthin glucosyltransferase [Stenotrophomonas sp. Betaine-02u-21]PKH94606.1 zeaxanthin glucosyltransferase [Stenotrophomonas sp. Bg11-02]